MQDVHFHAPKLSDYSTIAVSIFAQKIRWSSFAQLWHGVRNSRSPRMSGTRYHKARRNLTLIKLLIYPRYSSGRIQQSERTDCTDRLLQTNVHSCDPATLTQVISETPRHTGGPTVVVHSWRGFSRRSLQRPFTPLTLYVAISLRLVVALPRLRIKAWPRDACRRTVICRHRRTP